MRALVREATGYTLASACALAADMAILWCLVDVFSWQYLAAATASFSAGAVVAYSICVKLVFEQHRLRDRRAEFASFVAIGVVGLGVNAGVIYVGVHFFGVHVLVAKCCAAGFTFLCNFVLRRQLLFVRSPKRDRSPSYVEN